MRSMRRWSVIAGRAWTTTCLGFAGGPAAMAQGPSPTATGPCPTPAVSAVPGPTAPLVMPEDYRLALLDRIWQQLADGYIDPGMNGVDWAAVHDEYAQRILQAENAWEDYAILSDMVALLNDPDTLLATAPDLAAQAVSDPTYGGIGILIDTVSATTPEDGLWVLYVFPGSPALAAGIAPRDRILAVGDDPCPRPELIRGPVGTTVDLLIRSPRAAPRTVGVERQRIAPVYEPTASRIPGHPGIGYLRLVSLAGDDAPAAVTAALSGLLAGALLEGLVIDLRHTSQGAPGVTASVLGQFVGGDVATLVTHDGRSPYAVDAGTLRDDLRDVPVVVLVDGGTNGEAERLAAILQSEGRATVVGVRTPGHTQLLQQVPLPDGSLLQLVVGGLVTSDGTRLEGHGVIPDVEMTDDWQDQTVDDDTWLQVAVRSLEGDAPGTSASPPS